MDDASLNFNDIAHIYTVVKLHPTGKNRHRRFTGPTGSTDIGGLIEPVHQSTTLQPESRGHARGMGNETQQHNFRGGFISVRKRDLSQRLFPTSMFNGTNRSNFTTTIPGIRARLPNLDLLRFALSIHGFVNNDHPGGHGRLAISIQNIW